MEGLLIHHEVRAAVLVPALFIVGGAEGLLLAEADDLDTARGYAIQHQGIAHGFGAVLAECDVVLLGTAVIAMASENDPDVRMLFEEARILFDDRTISGRESVGVVIEVDILDCCSKSSDSERELWAGGAGGTSRFTVTSALDCALPPGPVAVRVKVVESCGETFCVPFGGTVPIPPMVAVVASVVFQVRTVDWPRSITFGEAVMEAVGWAAGGGNGGGGGDATGVFLWQPDRARIAERLERTASFRSEVKDNLNLPVWVVLRG